MAAKKNYKLDLKGVLQAIDSQNLGYYSSLTEEEKKHYVPLTLMRYMSSLTDQNKNSFYAVIAVNDLVNIGFWNLSKHHELQHMLLCLSGLGSPQYRPWIPLSRKKKAGKIKQWLSERFPHLNDDEIEMVLSQHDSKTWADFVRSSGVSDQEASEMISAWKKEKA